MSSTPDLTPMVVERNDDGDGWFSDVHLCSLKNRRRSLQLDTDASIERCLLN
jgi:hypothetical protein